MKSKRVPKKDVKSLVRVQVKTKEYIGGYIRMSSEERSQANKVERANRFPNEAAIANHNASVRRSMKKRELEALRDRKRQDEINRLSITSLGDLIR